jgi:hypothetical protein
MLEIVGKVFLDFLAMTGKLFMHLDTIEHCKIRSHLGTHHSPFKMCLRGPPPPPNAHELLSYAFKSTTGVSSCSFMNI